MTTSPRVTMLPWEHAPCQCVKEHTPVPVLTEQHHVYPQGEQIKAHGSVTDQDRVALCSTGHHNVHAYIDATLAGKPLPRINPYLRDVALRGVAKIRLGRKGGST